MVLRKELVFIGTISWRPIWWLTTKHRQPWVPIDAVHTYDLNLGQKLGSIVLSLMAIRLG